MKARSRHVGGVLLSLVFPVACAACSNSTPSQAGPAPAANSAAAAAKAPSAVPAPSASVSAPGESYRREFRVEDFSETERSRDPFRSFIGTFTEQAKTRVKSERKVLINRFSIDELKLVGLVTRTDVPRAMLVDPTGLGWGVSKGDFIGKAELVHAAGPGGVDYELNWRVDRIREGDVVLIREDPAHPDIPAATRVLALHADKAEASSTP